MKITQMATAALKPYARNARTHSDAQVAQIAASITEFGFNNPILIRDGQIVAGHGRWLAAQRLGIDKVPTIDLSHLSATQARAYVLADNQLALGAGWDPEMLRLELTELDQDGFDLSLLGFEDLPNELEDNPSPPKEESIKEGFSVLVSLETESAQMNLLDRLTQEGFQCRSLIA